MACVFLYSEKSQGCLAWSKKPNAPGSFYQYKSSSPDSRLNCVCLKAKKKAKSGIKVIRKLAEAADAHEKIEVHEKNRGLEKRESPIRCDLRRGKAKAIATRA